MARVHHVRRALVTAVVALLTLSCGGDDGPSGPAPDETPTVARIDVTPATATVEVGATVQLSATVVSSTGGTLSNPVTWSSSTPTVATVSSSGVVTGIAAGTATVSASAGGRAGTAAVSVVDLRIPEAPSELVAVAASDTAVDLAWTDNSDNEVAFVIEREQVVDPSEGSSAAAQAFTEVATVDADVVAFRDTGLTPETAYRYRLRARNENGDSDATAAAEVTTEGTLVVTTESLADATVGEAYDETLAAAGGSGVYTWSVTSGTLPEGTTLSPEGRISGSPVVAGAVALRFRVASGEQVADKELTLRVLLGLQPPQVTTDTLSDATVRVAYAAQIEAAFGDGTYVFSQLGGTLPDGLTLGADGSVSGTPTAAGTSTFLVGVTSAGMEGSGSVVLTVEPAPTAEGYQIDLVYQTPLTGPTLAAFEDARSRWEAIIVDDVPDEPDGLPACGERHPAPGAIDDLVIYVTVDSIDGPFGALGQAGPCFTRDDNLPLTGVMTFDSADLAFLHENGLLVPTILHEMGHVIGIGTMWDSMGLLTGDCLVDPIFTGDGALAAFDAAGGTAYTGGGKVPVENTGALDDGSNCAHWRESVLDKELMTPSLDQSAHPLSAITIRSLADQGYGVDVSQAEAFALPAPEIAGLGVPARNEGLWLKNDVLFIPLRVVHADGGVTVRPRIERRRW